MEITTTTKFVRKQTFGGSGMLISMLIILALAIPVYYFQMMPMSESLVEMAKGSEKNSKHTNSKARKSAEQKYQEVKEEVQALDKKPNKTPEDKKLIKKLRKTLERLRKKKDFSGENHSQKHKGS